MKFLFDFFPTLIFFVVYKAFGIFPATYAVIAASILQVALMWLKQRRVEPMHVILLVMILIFGGFTIYFHDVEFLMWKVSIVNWLLGGAMLISSLTKTNIIEYLFAFAEKRSNQKMGIPKFVTKRLNIAWGFFFVVVGFINIYIAHHYSLNVWVDFKVFGILGLTLIFVVGQSIYLMKYFKDEEPK